MKTRILAVIALLFLCIFSTSAQSPGLLNYQGVARDASKEPYTNQLVGLRFTILNSSAIAVYTETQSLTTNEYGLINTSIGGLSPASFEAVDWGADSYTLKVELDLGNDGSWEIDETKALNSVPYALYGEDADANPANEFQTLVISGNLLSITDGNSVVLPPGSDTDPLNELQTLTISGNLLSISDGNSVTLPAEGDGDPLNEIQTLSISGNQISISDGNNIVLPTDPDEDISNELQTLTISGNQISISSGNSIDLPTDPDEDVANELQSLSITGNQLSISSGNTIDLPSGTVSPWVTSGSIIYYNAGMVGIGTDTPLYPLHIVSNQLSGRDTMLLIQAADDPSSALILGNGTISDGKFMPAIISVNNSDHRQSLFITAQTADELDDLGGYPLMTFDVRRHEGVIENRPLFQWTSYTNPKMTMLANGNLGIGTTTPTRLLEVAGGITINGNIIQNNDHQIWRNNKALHLRQDDNISWISNIGNFVGNGSDSNGALCLVGENGIQLRYGYGTGAGTLGVYLTNGGRVGFGTTAPSSKVQIEGETDWSDEDALFEVKNKDGIPVFAVYNNGVRILVNDDPDDAKARTRGGFAVGGFDRDKAGYQETFDYMRITPDSVRFNIDNSAVSKAPGSRGGFAVGGFDRDKKGEINEDFMYLTPQGSANGIYNTNLGYLSGPSITEGGKNIFIGYMAGFSNTSGWSNVFLGDEAGAYSKYSDESSNAAVGIGYKALYNNYKWGNCAIGYEAGKYNTIGEKNTFLGTRAGWDSRGSNNVFVGYEAGYHEQSNQKLYISNSRTATPLIYGDFYTSTMMVVINGNSLFNPNNRLFYVNGTAGGDYAWYNDSDERLKENIVTVDDALDKVLNLRGVYYEWKDPDQSETGRKLGFIGQEAFDILPEVVSNSNDHYSMQYAPITAVLVEAIKEQQDIIEDQDTRIISLENELMEIKALLGTLLQKQE